MYTTTSHETYRFSALSVLDINDPAASAPAVHQVPSLGHLFVLRYPGAEYTGRRSSTATTRKPSTIQWFRCVSIPSFGLRSRLGLKPTTRRPARSSDRRCGSSSTSPEHRPRHGPEACRDGAVEGSLRHVRHLADAVGRGRTRPAQHFTASWERDAGLRLRRGDTDYCPPLRPP